MKDGSVMRRERSPFTSKDFRAPSRVILALRVSDMVTWIGDVEPSNEARVVAGAFDSAAGVVAETRGWTLPLRVQNQP